MRRFCSVDVKEENQSMEENKSMAKGCDEDDRVKMPLPLSSSVDFFNYNEFDYSFNQDEWLNLPGLPTTIDQELSDLSVEKIERNLEPKFGMISEKSNQLIEENKSMAKGCNEDDMVMMTEFPALPLLSSIDSFNYNEFDQEEWLNLPITTHV
ncbi:uncharacterized protein LOC113301702 [Papaver somniferum]|uniref:uncharacterized protein LOC113301702 n=1 Tax=Papaver somniferum TaxID=3469 RepID=UPI000E6FC322|nr:uncharacterized protein LOC113301702 [Papaver somniferum]